MAKGKLEAYNEGIKGVFFRWTTNIVVFVEMPLFLIIPMYASLSAVSIDVVNEMLNWCLGGVVLGAIVFMLVPADVICDTKRRRLDGEFGSYEQFKERLRCGRL